MVEMKFVIELIVIIAALAIVIYIFWTNYDKISGQFFTWLKALSGVTGVG